MCGLSGPATSSPVSWLRSQFRNRSNASRAASSGDFPLVETRAMRRRCSVMGQFYRPTRPASRPSTRLCSASARTRADRKVGASSPAKGASDERNWPGRPHRTQPGTGVGVDHRALHIAVARASTIARPTAAACCSSPRSSCELPHPRTLERNASRTTVPLGYATHRRTTRASSWPLRRPAWAPVTGVARSTIPTVWRGREQDQYGPEEGIWHDVPQALLPPTKVQCGFDPRPARAAGGRGART